MNGVLLAERVEGETKIFLYYVDSFYLELFHDIMEVRNNSIKFSELSKIATRLTVYLSI